MIEIIFWLYLINVSLLLVHEMDSAYHKEWELFNLPGGLPFFLFLHIPISIALLYGAILLHQQKPAGYIFAYAISFIGIFALSVHTYFNKKVDKRFFNKTSMTILIALFLLSLLQLILLLLL